MSGDLLITGEMYILQSFYQNEQWVGKGKFVAVIPAWVIPSMDDMQRFAGRTDLPRAGVARYIFEKENGKYIILPDAPRSSAFKAP